MTDEVKPGEAAPQETPEERDARLAAAYRAQAGGDVHDDDNAVDDKPQRPDHIPEKFWDAEKGEVRVEEMAKSYAELEKAKAKPAEEQPDERTPEEKAAAEGTAAEFTKYRESLTAKIVSGAELTDADYVPAEKIGLSREDVDTFIAGLQALGQLHAQKIHNEAGGEENYKAMIEWAKGTYTPAEIAAYDRDVYSNDPAVASNAVRGLTARYQLASGKSGKDVTKGGARATGDAYASKAEMVADMRDPKYAKDPAFRAKVASKIAAARAAGIELMQ